jgi:hypothetical protein
MADETKNIIISVSVDNTDAVAGIDEVKDKLDEVSDTPLDKPFKNFKQQIKEATLEAQKLEQQFGKNSQEFRNAATRVAELKDNYQEFGNSVKAFNPDNKLTSLTTAARGAVGAIQGVTGAMQFLGVESGDAQQAIARLQGLMAFSGALDSIDDIKTAYKDFKNVIKDSAAFQSVYNAATKAATAIQLAFGIAVDATSVSFKVLRGAIIATGIGALVVALGFVVNKFIEWNDATDDQTDKTKKLKDEEDKLNKALKDQQEIISRNQQILSYQTQLALLNAKARGASEKELRKIEKEGFEARLLELQTLENDLLVMEDTGIRAATGLKATKEEIAAYTTARINSQNAFQQYKLFEAQIKLDEFNANKNKTTTTKEVKEDPRIQAEKDYLKQLKELQDQNIKDEYERKRTQLTTAYDAEIAIAQEKYKGIEGGQQKINDLIVQLDLKLASDLGAIAEERRLKLEEEAQAAKDIQIEKDDEARRIRLEKEQAAADEEVRIQEEKNKFLQSTVDSTISILDAVNLFTKDNSDLQKGIAIAGVVIEKSKTIFDIISSAIKANSFAVATAAAQTLTNPYAAPLYAAQASARITKNTVFAGIQSGVVTAQALKTIQSIRSAGNTGDGGGGGAIPNTAAAPSDAPVIVGTQTAPQAIQDVRVTNQGQVPIRAFITDRDLRSNEQRNNFLNNLSTF